MCVWLRLRQQTFLEQILDSGGHLSACCMSADMNHLRMDDSTTAPKQPSASRTPLRRPTAPKSSSSETRIRLHALGGRQR